MIKMKVNNKNFDVVGHAEVRRIILSIARKSGFDSFHLLKNDNSIKITQLAIKDGDEFVVKEDLS